MPKKKKFFPRFDKTMADFQKNETKFCCHIFILQDRQDRANILEKKIHVTHSLDVDPKVFFKFPEHV